MENSSTHFECEVKNLGYNEIEYAIADYFDMGTPDNSSIPPEMNKNEGLECILVCTKLSGTFYISNYVRNDGKYELTVSLIGRLKRSY